MNHHHIYPEQPTKIEPFIEGGLSPKYSTLVKLIHPLNDDFCCCNSYIINNFQIMRRNLNLVTPSYITILSSLFIFPSFEKISVTISYSNLFFSQLSLLKLSYLLQLYNLLY